MTVTIQPVNDNAPELSVVPVGVAYLEGMVGGVELLSNVNLTDTDHNDVFNLTALHVSSKRNAGRLKCRLAAENMNNGAQWHACELF